MEEQCQCIEWTPQVKEEWNKIKYIYAPNSENGGNKMAQPHPGHERWLYLIAATHGPLRNTLKMSHNNNLRRVIDPFIQRSENFGIFSAWTMAWSRVKAHCEILRQGAAQYTNHAQTRIMFTRIFRFHVFFLPFLSENFVMKRSICWLLAHVTRI